MAWILVVLALLLPAACGVLALRLLLPGLHPATRLGAGYLLGCLVLGNVLWLAGEIPLAGLRGIGLPLLALLAAALGWLGRARPPRGAPVAAGPPRERQVVMGVLILLGVVGVLATIQALALPTLTWDAWNAWLAKPKAWLHAGAFVPVLPLEAWLQQPAGSARSTVAAAYPEALPRFAAWLAAAAGSWRDAYAHIAWPPLWAALGLLCYGRLREHALAPSAAVVAAGGLLTLPMFAAHASLAGYADLWLASAVLLAASSLFAPAPAASWPQRALGLLSLLLLPTIKLEGTVYAAMLLAAWALFRLPPRWRWATLVAGVVVGGGLFVTVGLWLPLPGAGWVGLRWGEATLPVFGSIALSWRPVAGIVAESLFLLPNWSLLWYLAPVALLLGWRRLAAPRIAALAIFLLGALLFHGVLFFFTPASAWAQDLTSLNRLLMHVVPVWVLLLALLLSPPAAVRGRAS
jgi:hypothetical protein